MDIKNVVNSPSEFKKEFESDIKTKIATSLGGMETSKLTAQGNEDDTANKDS